MKNRIELKCLRIFCLLMLCGTYLIGQLKQNFINPPLSLKSRPLWFWNAPLSREQTLKVMKASKEAGYYGLGIVPSYGMTPEFMTPEFLAQYKAAVEIAASLGMKLYLYDEFYFPSGMAGGQLVKQFPEAVSKRLDMELFEVKGPGHFSHPVPPGTVMGAVGHGNFLFKRIDLSDRVGKSLTFRGIARGRLEGHDLYASTRRLHRAGAIAITSVRRRFPGLSN